MAQKEEHMNKNNQTRELLTKHYQSYPELEISDVFKYIFQSAMGCEHLVSDYTAAVNYIKREHSAMTSSSPTLTDKLDGEYSRVHLSYLDRGLTAQTLGKLFCKSAKAVPNGKAEIENKLRIARELVADGSLPFALADFDKAVSVWENQSLSAIHHSEKFRKTYKPAYRVIANEYVAFLPLFCEIDKLLQKGSAIVAIEGGSASGKTTLSGMLEKIYDCTVFHIDDFFLRPEQRTPKRLSEIGGNMDRERFLSEVLVPLSQGENISYRRFDCLKQSLAPPENISPKKLTIIEGAYSMHPELAPYYALSVFLEIAPERQKQRILTRNSPTFATRFFEEWIPKERAYFSNFNIKESCDLCLPSDF